jgi:hypothetical protein
MKYLNALFGITAILVCASVTAAPLDVAGTYTAEISYTQETAKPDRKWIFGAHPDIEFVLTQKGDKISGEFSGDRDGKVKGKIDDEEVTLKIYLESLRGEIKDGDGILMVEEDGTLKGGFRVRDPKRGIVSGYWVLTKTE